MGLNSPGRSSSGLWFGGISVLVVVEVASVVELVLCTIRSFLLKLALLENTCLASIDPSDRLLNAIIELVKESECTGFSVGAIVLEVVCAAVMP